MPGSSLWLVPDPDSALHKTLATLITTSIPSLYPIALPPRFSPHVTLTADTINTSDDPQNWLAGLDLPMEDLHVKVKEPQVGEIFFRKLTLRCEKDGALRDLAVACRRAGTGAGIDEAKRWVEEGYAPHLSLLYSDLPQEELNAKMDDVRAMLRKAHEENPEAFKATGAEIWLVPTHLDIDDWKPIAKRKVEGAQWSWGV